MIADMSGPDCPKCGEYFLDCHCKKWFIPTELAYEVIAKQFEILLSEFFKFVSIPNFEDFKEVTLEASATMLDKIYEKYADHIEGLIRERKNDKRNSPNTQTT